MWEFDLKLIGGRKAFSASFLEMSPKTERWFESLSSQFTFADFILLLSSWKDLVGKLGKPLLNIIADCH